MNRRLATWHGPNRLAVLLLVLLCRLCPLPAIAAESFAEERRILVDIPCSSVSERDRVSATQIDIIGGTKGILRAIVTAAELEQLRSSGFLPGVVASDYRQVYRGMPGIRVPAPYHNAAQVRQILSDTASLNPDIATFHTIGKSVQNRDIVALRLAVTTATLTPRPAVRLVGLHHGDELSSSEFLLYLIRHLVEQYRAGDAEAVGILTGTEIWIVPTVNPDGMESGSRYNAHGYDINRNYSCPNGSHNTSIGGPYAFSEPEPRAIRDISQPSGNAINNCFVLGLTYHAGTECFNYVWNYTPTRAADDALLQFQGQAYADGAHAAGLTSFWVTDGYDWYQTIGDLNDWAYWSTGTLDTTIECTVAHTPAVTTQAQIDAFCLPHLRGTLFSLWLAGEGVRGQVRDAVTSQPLLATVSVREVQNPVYSDPHRSGAFFRVLLGGNYTIDVSAAGYATRTIPNVHVDPPQAANRTRVFTDLGIVALEPQSGVGSWAIY